MSLSGRRYATRRRACLEEFSSKVPPGVAFVAPGRRIHLREVVPMGPDRPQPEEAERLLEQVGAGDRQALERLLALHREFLRRTVELRLDRKMRGRVDASDVVQEAQLEAARRIDDYLQRRPMPFHL